MSFLQIGPVHITFHRTIRVSLNETSSLPPSLGVFPVYRVKDYKGNCPKTWKEDDIFIRNITVALKKYQGYKKSWTEKETFNRWKEELRQIVGDVVKLEIKSSEGNKLSHVEGMGKSVDGRIYAYRFIITIIKRERKRGEKNEK